MNLRSALKHWSWTNRLLLGLVIVLAIALVVVLTCGSPNGQSDETTATGVTATTGGTTGVAVTLIEVVDGDTIWVRMPDGSEEKVRYIGIDAPEIAHSGSAGEYLGEEATAHNTEVLASGPLRLETDVEERDEHGRLLAYVWAGDVFINERMVLDGYAWAHNYPPNTTRQDQLWAAHDQAHDAGRGIWMASDDQ